MKGKLKIILKKPLEPLIYFECKIFAWLVSMSYRHLKWIQWRIAPKPEYFDHHIDLYYQWIATRNPLWLERGIFGGLTLKGGKTLELACGDGFNACNFYSSKSKTIIACDFDPKAIKTAKLKNYSPNIKYIQADIRVNMPQGQFDNVVWDAAIEHFTPDEIKKILFDIKKRLKGNGILCGYTIVERKNQTKSLSQHEYEFKNKEDLLSFISPHFKNVKIFETIYPERHNLYFWASDREDAIPFNNNWPNVINHKYEFAK